MNYLRTTFTIAACVLSLQTPGALALSQECVDKTDPTSGLYVEWSERGIPRPVLVLFHKNVLYIPTNCTGSAPDGTPTLTPRENQVVSYVWKTQCNYIRLATGGRPAPTDSGFAGVGGVTVDVKVNFPRNTGRLKLKAPRLGVDLNMDLDCTEE